MTREEAKELLPIIQAFAEGKTIQSKQINAPDKEWRDIEECNFLRDHSYRIKPKYRPFRTQEECWEEMHKHTDFGYIKNIVRDEIVQIMRIGDEVLNVLDYTISPYAFGLAFQTFVFTDGTPFGVKEE